MHYIEPYLHIKGFLPSLALTFTWCAFLFRFRTSMWSLAFLALPGTAAHELAHYLVGLVLFAKPQKFTLLPRKVGNSWVLGSVSFSGICLLNAAFVAMAPFLLMPIAWLALTHIVSPLWIQEQWFLWFLANYLTATFLFAGIPSSQDFKVGGTSIYIYLTLATFWCLGRIL